MELEELKEYLKIDGTDEDITISNLQLATEVYLKNTGITKDYTNDLYKVAIKLLVAHWYTNRDTYTDMRTAKLDFSLETIIFSLKYSQEDVVAP